jgi:hypothetical protein
MIIVLIDFNNLLLHSKEIKTMNRISTRMVQDQQGTRVHIIHVHTHTFSVTSFTTAFFKF